MVDSDSTASESPSPSVQKHNNTDSSAGVSVPLTSSSQFPFSKFGFDSVPMSHTMSGMPMSFNGGNGAGMQFSAAQMAEIGQQMYMQQQMTPQMAQHMQQMGQQLGTSQGAWGMPAIYIQPVPVTSAAASAASQQVKVEENAVASTLVTLGKGANGAQSHASPAAGGAGRESVSSTPNGASGGSKAGRGEKRGDSDAHKDEDSSEDSYKVKRARNNEAVRKCRIKKKQQMQDQEKLLAVLQDKVEKLSAQNFKLQEKVLRQTERIKKLEEQCNQHSTDSP